MHARMYARVELDLAGCGVSSAGAAMLQAALVENATVVHIGLERNGLGGSPSCPFPLLSLPLLLRLLLILPRRTLFSLPLQWVACLALALQRDLMPTLTSPTMQDGLYGLPSSSSCH